MAHRHSISIGTVVIQYTTYTANDVITQLRNIVDEKPVTAIKDDCNFYPYEALQRNLRLAYDEEDREELCNLIEQARANIALAIRYNSSFWGSEAVSSDNGYTDETSARRSAQLTR